MITVEEVNASIGAFGDRDEAPLTIAYNIAIWGPPGEHLTKINFMGKTLLWHKWAVAPMMAVQKDLLAEGWDKKYRWNDLQTYNPRPIRGSTKWSMHSGPIAIDINPAQNPYGTHTTDIPKRIADIFKAHKFVWGYDWSHGDPMHFEYVGEPVKDDIINPPEEDDMTDQDRDMLKRVRLSALSQSFDLDIIKAMIVGDSAAVAKLTVDQAKAVKAEKVRLGLE